MADLDEIMESRPQGTEEQTTRDDGRDERGRFAGQAREQAKQDAETQAQREQVQAPAQVEQPDPTKPPPGFIPLPAFDARMAKAEEKFNERYAALEAQFNRLSQQQPRQQPVEQKPPPEFWDNPEEAFEARLNARLAPLLQQIADREETRSRMMASEKHGDEAVSQAFQDLKSRVGANPVGMQATYQRIMQSQHPYGELVKWHKEQAALSTYGDDPEAWRTSEREKMKAELLAEMQGGQTSQGQAPVQQAQQAMPSNFAGSRSNGPRSTASFSGPMPLSEIMGGR
jgi:hypothetical protein